MLCGASSMRVICLWYASLLWATSVEAARVNLASKYSRGSADARKHSEVPGSKDGDELTLADIMTEFSRDVDGMSKELQAKSANQTEEFSKPFRLPLSSYLTKMRKTMTSIQQLFHAQQANTSGVKKLMPRTTVATTTTSTSTVAATTTTTFTSTSTTTTSTTSTSTTTTTSTSTSTTTTTTTTSTSTSTTSTTIVTSTITQADFSRASVNNDVVDGVEEEEGELPWPTNDEYEMFYEVTDFDADLNEIVAIGRKVAAHIDDPEWPKEANLPFSKQSFLHKSRGQSLIRQKMKLPAYAGEKLKGTKIAIMGAGPSGLRLAIEAALHGATVHVLEKRDKFNRYNVLKLWSFTNFDIQSIGGKDLFKKLDSFGNKRIPIAVLQHVLMRVALALGVNVHPACAVKDLRHADSTLILDSKYDCRTRAQFENVDFDAIFDGTGTTAVLRDSETEDGEALIPSTTKGREMFGLTMNFKRYDSKLERKFYEDTKGDPRFKKFNPAASDDSNLAYQFARDLFNEKDVQINNWVYWKSDSSHYIVITIPRQTLIDQGVAPARAASLGTDELLKSINKDELVSLGLEIAREWNMPHETEDASAFVVNGAGKPDLALFDFGMQTQADLPCQFLPGKNGKFVYFGVVGDTLKTPFWPYGTGANHAFYSSHLQTWALLAWKSYNYGEEATTELAETMMKAMLSMKTEGNKLGFSKKDYEQLVTGNYDAVAKKKKVLFY